MSDTLAAAEREITGVLWADDAQVAHLTVEKVIGTQGEAPYVEIAVVEEAAVGVVRGVRRGQAGLRGPGVEARRYRLGRGGRRGPPS